MLPLNIAGVGAVTAVGLTAAQTCAAIRAKLPGFREVMLLRPPAGPVVAARIPARQRLRVSSEQWLANMATRAFSECIRDLDLNIRRTALLIALPDAYRNHAGLRRGPTSLLAQIQRTAAMPFHSTTLQQGHAGAFAAFTTAGALLARGDVTHCIVGGVDSLVNQADVQRLASSARLHGADNPQGVVPGEGAAFVVLARAGDERQAPVASLFGVGVGSESDNVLGQRYATGRGLRQALEAATRQAEREERQIDFRISDMNGERYRAWDSLIAAARFYRTRRSHHVVWYPAASVGDVGAASAPLSLIVAADAIARGYAPGPFGMCEGASDDGFRGGCVVGPALKAPLPPFRDDE